MFQSTMRPLEFCHMLVFGFAVGFHVAFQVGLGAETASAVRALAKRVHVCFLAGFLIHAVAFEMQVWRRVYKKFAQTKETTKKKLATERFY
jgi:hypothetical protein